MCFTEVGNVFGSIILKRWFAILSVFNIPLDTCVCNLFFWSVAYTILVSPVNGFFLWANKACFLREGVSKSFYCPEPYSSLTKKPRHSEAIDGKTWKDSQHKDMLKKLLFYQLSNLNNIPNLTRTICEWFNDLFTVLPPSEISSKKMSKVDSQNCRFCNEVAETAEHMLYSCTSQFCKRLKYLEGWLNALWHM